MSNNNVKSLLDSVKHLGVDADGLVDGIKELKRQRLVNHLEQRYRNLGVPALDALIDGVVESKQAKKKSIAKKTVEAVVPLRKVVKKEEDAKEEESKVGEPKESKTPQPRKRRSARKGS